MCLTSNWILDTSAFLANSDCDDGGIHCDGGGILTKDVLQHCLMGIGIHCILMDILQGITSSSEFQKVDNGSSTSMAG